VFTDLAVNASEEFVAEIRADRADLYRAQAADMTVAAGSPDEVAATLAELWAAGADTVVLRPRGTDPSGEVRAVLAALGRG
jgi:alkanesulfonate monooxygenase SsuD/methylene tetrahydromethanopterin reductase-like flavin-dependent oxidoreductase (luciferase family)